MSNAKIDLVPAAKRPSSQLIKVRVQAVDLPPEYSSKLVGDFASHATVWNILKHFEKLSGINFTERSYKKTLKKYYEIPTVQLFNRVLTRLEQLDESLYEMGIEDGSVSLRVRFEKSDLALDDALSFHKNFRSLEMAEKAKEEVQNRKTTHKQQVAKEKREEITQKEAIKAEGSATSASSTISDSGVLRSNDENPMATTGPSNVKVFKPESNPSTTPEDAASESEMTPRMFNHYVNNLKNMSEGPQHLMTKSMKETAEAEKLSKITEITLRIRFPNHEIVEATFKGTDSTDSVYEFVKKVLKYQYSFNLFITPPKQILESGKQLSRGYKLGKREIIHFEWIPSSIPKTGIDSSVSVLKPEYQQRATSLSAELKSEAVSSKTSSAQEKEKKKLVGKPKWMKLSKK